MKITCEFAPADRCLYDLRLCSIANGWEQARDLRISIGDAWRADAALSKFGAITHDIIGRMVPLPK